MYHNYLDKTIKIVSIRLKEPKDQIKIDNIIIWNLQQKVKVETAEMLSNNNVRNKSSSPGLHPSHCVELGEHKSLEKQIIQS